MSSSARREVRRRRPPTRSPRQTGQLPGMRCCAVVRRCRPFVAVGSGRKSNAKRRWTLAQDEDAQGCSEAVQDHGRWQGGSPSCEPQPYLDQEDHEAEAQAAQSDVGLAGLRLHHQRDPAQLAARFPRAVPGSHIRRYAGTGGNNDLSTEAVAPRLPAREPLGEARAGLTAPLEQKRGRRWHV